MAFETNTIKKKSIQSFKYEGVLIRDQSNKRKACALKDVTLHFGYDNHLNSKKTFPLHRRPEGLIPPQGKIYKHIQPVFPNRQSIQEKDVTATIANDADLDRSMIFETLGLLPIAFQNARINKIRLPSSTTVCIEPVVSRDYDYQCEYLMHFRQRERNFRPKPHYLKQQIEVDHASRALLVNWLVMVINESNFDTETLYLTVSYIDRFLSQIVMSRNRLELVGITAIYVAAKYEETRPPGVKRFSFIGGIKFDTKQIVKMERLLLSTLSYDLHAPTSYAFASAYASLTGMPHLLKFLTLYICELSLLEAEPYLQFLPSQISAASLALARYLLGYQIWSKQLEKLTMYRLKDLKQIFMFLCKTHLHATMLYSGAIQSKFMEERYHQVATIAPVNINDFVFDQFVEKYNSL